jgi:ubiquinone biosynthesis protein
MRLCSAPGGFDARAFSADIMEYVSFYGHQPIERLRLGEALGEMVRILSRYRLVLPSGAASLVKTFAMLEGTARLLSPTVNVLELVKSYQRKIVLRRLSPQAQVRKWRRLTDEWGRLGEIVPRGLGEMLQKVQEGRFDIHLEHRRLEPFVNRLAMGLITSALFLGSAVLWSNRVPPVVHGYSVAGVLGCAVSLVLGSRLVGKIWRE